MFYGTINTYNSNMHQTFETRGDGEVKVGPATLSSDTERNMFYVSTIESYRFLFSCVGFTLSGNVKTV